MTEPVRRAPFLIGQAVRCPHGEVRVVVSEHEQDGHLVVDVTGWSLGPRPYHTHPVEELHHGHVKREWIDDD